MVCVAFVEGNFVRYISHALRGDHGTNSMYWKDEHYLHFLVEAHNVCQNASLQKHIFRLHSQNMSRFWDPPKFPTNPKEYQETCPKGFTWKNQWKIIKIHFLGPNKILTSVSGLKVWVGSHYWTGAWLVGFLLSSLFGGWEFETTGKKSGDHHLGCIQHCK